MCPAMFIPLDHIPLNSHGKLDRRAIAARPLPTVDGGDQQGDADLSETELALRELWATRTCSCASNDSSETDSTYLSQLWRFTTPAH